MPGRGRGHHPALVRHQLQVGGGESGRRVRERHAGRGPVTDALERAQQRAEQFPAGQAARTGGALRGGGEVGGQEGVGQLPGDHRLRHDLPLGGDGDGGRGLHRRDHFRPWFDAEVPLHLPLERPGRVGDVGVLGQQRHQPGVPDGGGGEDGGDAVQALELLLGATVVASGFPDAGALVPQQQGDGLELRAYGGCHPATLGRRLELTGVAGELGDDIAAVTDAPLLLLARGGAASAPLALA